MSTMIPVTFKHDEIGANNALHKLQQLQEVNFINLECAIVVRRRKDGKIKLHLMVDPTDAGAWHGAFWVGLIELYFTGPLGWLVVDSVGAGFGVLSGYLRDYGIDDFIKSLSEEVEASAYRDGSS